jgi:hypothetical protein
VNNWEAREEVEEDSVCATKGEKATLILNVERKKKRGKLVKKRERKKAKKKHEGKLIFA